VIERRLGVLLLFNKEIEFGLLRCGRLQLEDHPVKAGLGIHRAHVVLRTRQRVYVSSERDELRLA